MAWQAKALLLSLTFRFTIEDMIKSTVFGIFTALFIATSFLGFGQEPQAAREEPLPATTGQETAIADSLEDGHEASSVQEPTPAAEPAEQSVGGNAALEAMTAPEETQKAPPAAPFSLADLALLPDGAGALDKARALGYSRQELTGYQNKKANYLFYFPTQGVALNFEPREAPYTLTVLEVKDKAAVKSFAGNPAANDFDLSETLSGKKEGIIFLAGSLPNQSGRILYYLANHRLFRAELAPSQPETYFGEEGEKIFRCIAATLSPLKAE